MIPEIKPILRRVQGLPDGDEPSVGFVYGDLNWTVVQKDTINMNDDESDPIICGLRVNKQGSVDYVQVHSSSIRAWT